MAVMVVSEEREMSRGFERLPSLHRRKWKSLLATAIIVASGLEQVGCWNTMAWPIVVSFTFRVIE